MRALCRKGRAAASPVRHPITTSPTLLFAPLNAILHTPSLPSSLARRSGGSPPCAFLVQAPVEADHCRATPAVQTARMHARLLSHPLEAALQAEPRQPAADRRAASGQR